MFVLRFFILLPSILNTNDLLKNGTDLVTLENTFGIKVVENLSFNCISKLASPSSKDDDAIYSINIEIGDIKPKTRVSG